MSETNGRRRCRKDEKCSAGAIAIAIVVAIITTSSHARFPSLQPSKRATQPTGGINMDNHVALMREAISAAAALVKVRQRIRPGEISCKSRRSTRSVSTLVFPVPALADTQTECSGLDAMCCCCVTVSYIVPDNAAQYFPKEWVKYANLQSPVLFYLPHY